jgi:hypothetical protein
VGSPAVIAVVRLAAAGERDMRGMMKVVVPQGVRVRNRLARVHAKDEHPAGSFSAIRIVLRLPADSRTRRAIAAII